MKILLDHNVTRLVRPHLLGHDVRTTREQGWDQLANGILLRAAAGGCFDVLLTTDKKMEYEQNLRRLPLPVVVLDAVSNDLADLLPFIPATLALLASGPLAPALYMIAADGTVTLVTAPRPKP